MKNKKESGEVVVEASIVVTLVMIVITIMLYVGMVLYQQTLVSVMANQTATNIAQVYSNALKDPFTGYADPDKAYQSVTYSNMKTDAYLDVIKQKGSIFTQYRLRKAQILPTVSRDVDVQIVSKPNELLKAQIVVSITDSYNVPLVGFFGADGELSFTATGRADCVDYLEYLFGVEAIADPENSPIPSLPDSDTCIVTFVKDKYTGGFHAAVPVLRGKTIVTSNRYSHSTMPENPVYNGMKFTGWKTEDGRRFTAHIQVDENMTVYGTWECIITFDPTGGTVDPTQKTVEYHKTTTFPNPERNGYIFEGWYTEKNGGGTKYVSGVTEIPGNITLYAKWRCAHAEFTHKQLEAGTCTTRSTWLHECTNCDYSYTDRGGYGTCEKGDQSASVEASCTTPGWYVVNCKYCGRQMESGTVAALGHRYAANGVDYDETYYREPTCYRTGIQGSRCSRCGVERGQVLSKVDHKAGCCNKTHKFGYEVGLSVNNGKVDYTLYGRCIVCVYCHKGKYERVNGKTTETWNGTLATGRYDCSDELTYGQYCFESGCAENWLSKLEVVPIH